MKATPPGGRLFNTPQATQVAKAAHVIIRLHTLQLRPVLRNAFVVESESFGIIIRFVF